MKVWLLFLQLIRVSSFLLESQNAYWLIGVLAGTLVLALIALGWVVARLITFTRNQKHARLRIQALQHTAQVLRDAEEGRQVSEEQFRLFLDNLGDIAVIMNKDGVIRYISPSVQPVLGYTPEELLGTTPWALLSSDHSNPPADPPADPLQSGIEQMRLLDAPITTLPQRILGKDGSLHWIEASINPQLKNPRIKGIFIVARDVTERVQAEQILRESENRFRTIADSTPMLIWMAEPDGHNSFNNKWLMEFTGLPKEELEGNNWRRVLHPDDVAGFDTTDNQVLHEHTPFTHEYRLRRADGQYRWMLDRGIPRFSPDGSYLGFIGTVLDIHERKTAAAALQEREAQYRSIFESVSDGLEISDPATRQVIDVNPAMCAMHGYTREEYINLPNNAFVAPGNPHFTGRFLEEFNESQPEISTENFVGRSINVHKDGHQFDVQVAVKTIYQNGKLRLLTVVRDITEQVVATHALEQGVKERTNHLRQLLDVSQAISSTLNLDSLMQLILDKLRVVVPYTTASIALVDPPGLLMTAKRVGLSHHELPDLEWAYKPEDLHINQILIDCLPVNIPDVYADDPFAAALRASMTRLLGGVPSHIQSWLGVPMVSEDQAIGLLILEAETTHAYDDQAIERIMPFANHAATAIENSRLKDTAMQSVAHSATMAERRRIALELHDSVSQALFGIVLGARTAKEQTERTLAQIAALSDAAQPAKKPLNDTALNAIDYTLDLAEGALAEMRTLIFELRPESLAQEGLTIALQKQALGLMARQKINVETVLGEEPNLPVASKEAMYRIAVEALQNVVKHSGATQVKLVLMQQPALVEQDATGSDGSRQSAGVQDSAVVLSIIDNGHGFDPDAFYPGHMGLQSMRERAEKIKGILDMDSKRGFGTHIKLTVPVQLPRSGISASANRSREATPILLPDQMTMR